MNKKWKSFQKLTEKCYENMIGAEEDDSCWQNGFELLKELVLEERKTDPQFAPELELLDDATDYRFDIEGWLEDCLDEMDMREDHAVLLRMCDDLLKLFTWSEYTGSDLKFRKVGALNALGKVQKAAEFCDKWIEKESENIVAATAGVYAYMKNSEQNKARKLIEKFIPDGMICCDDNDIMFTAASRFYEKVGDTKKHEQMEEALEAYDQKLEAYFSEYADMDDDDELLWDEEDLPFC